MLHLWEIEEGPKALPLGGAERGVVVEEVEPEVDEAADGGLAVDENVGLRQVPAPGPDEECCELIVVELVQLVPGIIVEADRAVDRVPQVDLPPHQVLPARRERVLKVGLRRKSKSFTVHHVQLAYYGPNSDLIIYSH